MSKLRLTALAGALLLGAGLMAVPAERAARAAEAVPVPDREWSFEGLTGYFDRASAQRGLQVYREVCSACHGLQYIAFRNLSALGYSEEEVKAIAAEYMITDGPDDFGEMYERPGLPSDYFPDPFPNDKAAAAANNGAVPPDLSLIAKARANGADYLHALLTGYEDPPPDMELMPGLYYNKYFPGNQIAMAQPLYEDGVGYADGTEATVAQMAHDVSMFLMWAAEPKLEQRKQTGISVILFLIVFTGVLYMAKRKIWSDLH